jgi:hypothetical protein
VVAVEKEREVDGAGGDDAAGSVEDKLKTG